MECGVRNIGLLRFLDYLLPPREVFIEETAIATSSFASAINSEITAEALESVAKKAHMPPEVMKNLPKTMGDFNKPRVRLNQ